MELHTPSGQSVTSSYASNAFKYQVSAVQALLNEGFDHDAMLAIATVVQLEGREGLNSYLNQYLHAIKGASLTEVSSLIIAVDNKDLQASPPPQLDENSIPSPMHEDSLAPLRDTYTSSTSNKRRCKEARRLSTLRTNAISTRSMQFSTAFCTQLGCNKVYKLEGHFVNHFKKNHSKAHIWICAFCTHDFRRQGIEAFARHIWDNHMDTKGFASDSMAMESPRHRSRLLSGIQSKILATGSRSGSDHPVISQTQLPSRLDQDFYSSNTQRAELHKEAPDPMSHEPMEISELEWNDTGGLLAPPNTLHGASIYQTFPLGSGGLNDDLSTYSEQTVTNHDSNHYPSNCRDDLAGS